MPVFSTSSIPSCPLLSMWQPWQSFLVLWDMPGVSWLRASVHQFLLSLPGLLPSFLIWWFFFFFFFYLGFSSSSPISETPSAASSSQISSLLWFSVLAAPPFCVGSFFCGVILGWNVSIWWAGTFLLSVASSAPSAEPGFQRYTSHVSKSINQSWISSDVKELTVECWVVGHLKIVITVSYFKSYCQLKNEKNSMTGFKDF